MSFIQRLFGRSEPSSRETAKQRLQLVLVHDRNQIEPGMLERIKDDIIAVISKHVEIDREHVDISFSRGERENRLTANIPLLSSRSRNRK